MSQRTVRLVFGVAAIALLLCFAGFSLLTFLPPAIQRIQGKGTVCQDAMCTYTNAEYSFTVTTPPNWEPRTNSSNPFQILYIMQPGTSNAITIEHYPKNGNQSFDDFVSTFRADGEQSRDGTNRRNFTSGAARFHGGEAAVVEYLWTGDGIDYRTRVILFPYINEIYSFWLTAEPQGFTGVVPVFDEMRESFRAVVPASQ